MKLVASKPILYLITPGATAESTTAASPEFQAILRQVSAATAAGVDLIQIREKRLTTRVLGELTERAVNIAKGTPAKILVNDRADVAAGCGADGVHLTTQSIAATITRRTFGENFLIGVSTHSLAEATAAREGGADFAVIGPIFQTTSKQEYGPPLGVTNLGEIARELKAFPLLALGGVSIDNTQQCLRAGASGIAGISLFADPNNLAAVVNALKATDRKLT